MSRKNSRNHCKLDPESPYPKIRDRWPVLSKDKITELFCIYRRNDPRKKDALESIVYSNLGLVFDIARDRFRSYRSYTYEDVVDIGVTGLMRAIKDFDPARSAFSTYATWWIKQSIRRAYKNENLVRVPEMVQDNLHKIFPNGAEKDNHEGGDDGTSGADTFFYERRRITSAQCAVKAGRILSLDEMVDKDGCEEDTFAQSVASRPACSDLVGLPSFYEMISCLNMREQTVILNRVYFGETQEEAACALARIERTKPVTHTRISQIEQRAYKKLRARLARYKEDVA